MELTAPTPNTLADPKCLIWGSRIRPSRCIKVVGLEGAIVGHVDSEAFKTEIVWPLKAQMSRFRGFATIDGERVFDLAAFVTDRRTRPEVIERLVMKAGRQMADAIADIHAAHRKQTAPTRELNTVRAHLRRTGAATAAAGLPN